jgi:RHS repeat-associated protein
MTMVRKLVGTRRWLIIPLFVVGTAIGGWLWQAADASATPTCSIYWTGATSQDWATTGNWSLTNGGPAASRLPERTDYVCMSSAPAKSTVDLNSGESETVAGINWPATATFTPSLDVESGGALTIGTTSGSDSSTIASLTDNDYVATDTSVAVTKLTMPSGELYGTGTFTVGSSGTLQLSDGGQLEGGITVINDGAANAPASSDFTIDGSATLQNDGTLTLADSSTIASGYEVGSTVNESAGTVSFTGSAASSSASISTAFDNYGTVDVTKGTLTLQGGSSAASTGDTGSYNASSAGTVQFSGFQEFSSGVTFPGSGQIEDSGELYLPSGVGADFSNLFLDGGTMAGRGTVTIPSGGTSDLAGGTLSGGLHYVNDGTTTEAAVANIAVGDASVIQNFGTMTLADNATFQATDYNTDGWIVNESGGSLSYTGSASSGSTNVDIPLDNFGAVTVNKGTLYLSGTSGESYSGDSGSYTTAAQGNLNLGGYRTLAKSATFSGTGQVTLTGTLQLNNGTNISFPNILLEGDLSGKGTVTIPSGDSATLDGVQLTGGITVDNNGSSTVSTDTSNYFDDYSVLNNFGTLALSDDSSLGYNPDEDYSGTFENETGGTVSYAGSATNSTATIQVAFDNFGTVTVSRGTLTTSGGSSAFSAGDSGTYNVSAPAFLDFNDNYRALASSVSFPGSGEVTDNGYLEFLGSTKLPDFNLQGTVEADPGVVVTATLSQTPSGSIYLDGDRPGDYGEFVSTSSMNVGSLSLTLNNPTFVPPCGTVVTASQASSLTGTFNGVTDNNIPSGASTNASYSKTTAKVSISCPVPAVSEDQTYGTGSGIDEVNPSGYFAEPVNTATGAYSTQQTDAQLAGLGVPFGFTRYYSSDNTTSGPLGPGWSDSYDISLQNDGSTVYVTAENGQQSTFYQQSGDTYYGAAGVDSQLTETSTGWTLIRKNQTELTFNTSGQLLSIANLNGIGVTMAYNSSGQLKSVTEYGGRTVTFTYNKSGLLTSISLPLSRTVKYTYSKSGQLASGTDAAGDVTKYTYAKGGELATIVDANGHTVVSNTYNSSGQVTAQVNADGQKSTFAYNSSTGVTTFTDANGHKWEDTYSGYVLVSRTNPLGDKTSYQYDANLDVSAITSPNGNTTLMNYDQYGDLTARYAPSPLNYEESWTYNGFDEPTSYTDGNGNITSYTYDSRGNLLQVTSPNGSTVSHTYSSTNGELLSTTTAAGDTTTYGYDSSGDLTSQTDALGNETTYTYDAAGRLVSKVSPRGNVSGGTPSDFSTSYTYDLDNRQLTVTNPLGQTTTTTYDKVGNVLSVTDPLGNKTSYSYDDANHLLTVTAPNGSTTTTTYDPVGNVLTRVDGNGNTTTYTYTAANQLASTTSALGNTTTDTYDADGNLTQVVDAVGAKSTYTYDQLDRRTGVSYSDGTPSVTYSYDADNNVIKMIDGTGTTSYTYNNVDELTGTKEGTSGFSYTYTPDGLVSSRTYPDGLSITATYNGDDDLASITSGGATTDYAYDPDGNLITTTLPSSTGVTETRTYNDADQLTGVQAATSTTTIDAYTITRDADGNPTALTTPTGPITYTYDSLGRITEACYGTSCATNKITYTYDNDGNITAETNGSTTTTNTFNAGDELTQSVAGSTTTTNTFDADGRETASGSTTYTYNAANELTSTTKAGTTTTYTYDGNGNRVTSTVGSNETTYTWDTNSPLAELATTTTGSSTENYLWGDGSLGFTTSSGSYFDLHDYQGSTVGVISSTGVLQSTASYDPYGNTISSTNVVGTAPSQQIAWQGQVLDLTGQYDLRAREYNPASATFLSVDPLPQATTASAVSPYSYGADRPTVNWDPSGECFAGIFGSSCSTAGQWVNLAIGATFTVIGCATIADGVSAAACVFGIADTISAIDQLTSSYSNTNYYSTEPGYGQGSGYYNTEPMK